MSGVSRYFSRREKHHDKHGRSKSKVSASFPFLCSPQASGPAPKAKRSYIYNRLRRIVSENFSIADVEAQRKRKYKSLAGYEKLQALVPAFAFDSRLYSSSIVLPVSLLRSNANETDEYIFPIEQSRVVAIDLYGVFSTEPSKKTDKEEEKKVCLASRILQPQILIRANLGKINNTTATWHRYHRNQRTPSGMVATLQMFWRRREQNL
jgi:hypothetical protein